MTADTPGRDEIVLTSPQGRNLCNSRTHRKAGRLAGVIVTSGILADPGSFAHSKDALWSDCWGKSYPMCEECWQLTAEVAAGRRPGLVIHDVTRAAPASGTPPS
ncbi:MAG TPA: hypothetical protein VMV17_21720 [Streptosporangiaceae bacterium]|nr:hypothetical protein [Streptosporangiaceae bacterium]